MNYWTACLYTTGTCVRIGYVHVHVAIQYTRGGKSINTGSIHCSFYKALCMEWLHTMVWHSKIMKPFKTVITVPTSGMCTTPPV